MIGTLCCLLGLIGQTASVDAGVERIRADFRSLRPSDADLMIYRLAWTTPYSEARTKALKEKAPMAVVVVRNGHGDTFTGFC